MDFRKRTYRNPIEFFADIFFPIRNIRRLKKIRNEGLLSPALQERLMLAVTVVNG